MPACRTILRTCHHNVSPSPHLGPVISHPSSSAPFSSPISRSSHHFLFPSPPPSMADRQPRSHRAFGGPNPSGGSTLLRRLQNHTPNSTQIVGFLTLLISGAILLLLTGMTITGTVLGLIFLGPVILLTSPIWVPVAVATFVGVAGFLSVSGVVVAALAGATWLYRYFRGRHPVGSDRVDYARSRIADTASHVKDYAREYGGYFQSRPKDAAPGA